MTRDEIRRIVDQFDLDLPLASASSLLADCYRDPAIERLERSAVFGAEFVYACRSEQVATPGSVFRTQIGDEPIIVVRDERGTLRALSNVCRHKASTIVEADCSTLDRLRCRYHGWTYDLAGRLRGVPEFDGVENFSREANRLEPFACVERAPWVFVKTGPERDEKAATTSEPTEATSISAFRNECWNRWNLNGLIDGLRFYERRTYELNCNWKVFVDNYLDGGYHVNTVHPSLAGVLDYSTYKTHLFAGMNAQVSGMRSPDRPGDDDSARDVRTGDTAYYLWLFPNLMINIYSGMMDVDVVTPLGHDRCRVTMDYYYPPPRDEADRSRLSQSVEVGHQIQLEDVGVCEEVQLGLSSRAYRSGRYSVRREAGVHQFHQMWTTKMKRSLESADESC